MSILAQLRDAARSATETEVQFSGGDPAELIAVINEIAARENCTAVCTVSSKGSHFLKVCFRRSLDDATDDCDRSGEDLAHSTSPYGE